MIAKVRIAPVERWCPEYVHGWASRGHNPLTVVGMEVRIIVSTMKKAEFYGGIPPCTGREWQVEQSSANEIRAVLGQPPINNKTWICEHMLELD